MITDLRLCLQVALEGAAPPIPVLDPRDVLQPAEWEEETPEGDIKAGGERGLHVYLRQKAPAGYVQLLHPTGLLSNGVTDTSLTRVEVIAPDLDAADALAARVRAAIGNVPARPTRWTFSTRNTFEQDDHTRVVLDFDTRALGV